MENITERPYLVLLSLAWLGLSSCASLDPQDDLARAQRLVADRTQIAADWTTPWHPDAVSWRPEQALSAADAARLALRNHAGLRVVVESVIQARADYVQAHLLPNPVINFNLGFPIDDAPNNPAMGTLLQPLSALWERPARIDAADARLRATVLSLSNAALRLVADAESAHARLVYAERDLSLANESLMLARVGLELIDQRLSQGEATQLDRNRHALELLYAETRTTDAVVRRDRAHRQLLQVCGVAAADDMPRTNGEPIEIPSRFAQVSEAELIDLAEHQRLDLAASRALAAGAVDEADLAELLRIPQISAGAAYMRNFQGQDAVGPAVALELPIFDRGDAKVARAQSVARAAAAEAERIRQGAIAEVRDAWVRLRGALDNIAKLRGAILELAVNNRVIAEEALAAGVIDRGTLIELKRRELSIRRETNALELDATEWFIELERAVGGRLEGPAPSAAAAPGETP